MKDLNDLMTIVLRCWVIELWEEALKLGEHEYERLAFKKKFYWVEFDESWTITLINYAKKYKIYLKNLHSESQNLH